MQWFKVLNTAQIPTFDSIKTIAVNGKQVCIIKTAGKIYATQSFCPHAGGNFGGGWCKNGQLVCPIHRYAYNLETGRGAEGQGDYINIFPTELREDGLYIGFKESWWSKLWG
ncbi:(2Fe-2S)-binding protein [Pedobacter yonginense]|uniref:(2Fe-2S)-binding protein n=1 Tax=Pedobacter yonginense TaxID=651869 RepID=A0A317EPT6_9SPHI|nr:Rieske 2Fe-2S domain-containing protein [Pedobacter yonginense]PWS28920.1 (2Fe-2S)-binding protein [Pedobacter yonginense]